MIILFDRYVTHFELPPCMKCAVLIKHSERHKNSFITLTLTDRKSLGDGSCVRRWNVTGCVLLCVSRRSVSAPWVHREQLEPLHRPAGPPAVHKQHQYTTPAQTSANSWSNAHPSLRTLLQTLQERRHIIVVVDLELHVLPHNPHRHVLEESSSQWC